MQKARLIPLRARQLHRLACLRSLQLWPAAMRRGDFQNDHPEAVAAATVGLGSVAQHENKGHSSAPGPFSPSRSSVPCSYSPIHKRTSISTPTTPVIPTAKAQLLQQQLQQQQQPRASSFASTCAVVEPKQQYPEYELKTGISLFAKRASPPFPPPFDRTPQGKTTVDGFRDFHFSRHRHGGGGGEGGERNNSCGVTATANTGSVGLDNSFPELAVASESQTPPTTLADSPVSASLGQLRGISNGDDAVIVAPSYIGVADGVGAWNTRAQGNAALWSRLILHFWAMQVECDLPPPPPTKLSQQQSISQDRDLSKPLQPTIGKKKFNPVESLQKAYETVTSLTAPFPYLGTTTACMAIMLPGTSTLLLTNVGDSQAFVFRPSTGGFVARTEEQWHWFDCPRQLGTNSPDTPVDVGVVTPVGVEEGDVVVVATDGLMDNLWEGEVVEEIMACLEKDKLMNKENGAGTDPGVTQLIADRLVERAKAVAGDPWGLSPYMERAVEQGLGVEGGKWDDISVCVGRISKRKSGDGGSESGSRSLEMQ
ncbi:phosphatase 2C-like domain-containing protein [Peziza echinospora]|nr:phosphatase 2C-like domain-containing protein [Peziza echinospora]